MSALAEEFNKFANLFPEPILLVSSAGHIYAANATARSDLLQYAAFTSEHLVTSFLEDDARKVLAYLRDCSRTAQPLPGLWTFRRASGGGQFRCQGCAFRSRDEQERPVVMLRFAPKHESTNRFVVLNQQIDQLRAEISRRMRLERELDDERQLLQVTLSSIGDAVVTTDLHGRITFMNPVAEVHMGRRATECFGRPLTEVFTIRNEYTGEPSENPVQKVLRTGAVVGLANHTVLVRKDGSELPIDDSAAPIRDARGDLFGVVLVFHEISESRRLQRALMRQTEALKEADRRKDQFLAVLAHELRNPLAPIRNGLQIAKMKVHSDETLNRTVAMMERQVVHLVRLVNDLMDVSRVSRGVIELRKAPVFITDVLARSLESVRADIEGRGHVLETDVQIDKVSVNGDADRLTQVFTNLLINSVKYSRDGGFIRVSASQHGTEVIVTVTDKGIGIPPDQLESVFEMFSQVRGHQGRSEGGLGIGLSLTRTLVEMHGGSVTAHSEGIGRGSTFTVRLPVMKEGTAEVLQEDAPPRRIGPALRILVVDDNHDAAQSLGLLLEAAGHQVRLAGDGYEALRLVDDFRPAIIFMDLGMPGMDGLTATKLIREKPRGKNMMIVALTGWGQPQDRERTRAAGIDRHIVKPIGPEDLAEVLSVVTVT